MTVFKFISADNPPMQMERWYGGHAAVPNDLIVFYDDVIRIVHVSIIE